MIAPADLLAKATMCKQFSDAHTSNLTQAICAHYLTLNRLDDTLAVVRSTYAERARVMAQSCSANWETPLPLTHHKAGCFFGPG
jgi:2-aminoadipate transaminase